MSTLSTAGISTGSTFATDMVAVGGDGTVYVGNLTTSASSPFKVYAYATPNTPSAAPTVVYSGNPLGGGTRLGDSLAAIGSGTSTMLVAGSGSGNSYQIINPSLGTATAIAFSGTPPNAKDFQFGITFTDPSHVIGTSAGSGIAGTARYTSFSGAAGALVASPALSGSKDTVLGYISVGGDNILASASTGDNHVALYDMNDPTHPVEIASINNTTGTLPANGNETGDITFGPVTENPDGTYIFDLYSMSSNDGIQAFQVLVAPEPSTDALAVLGAGSLLLWRRRGVR